MIGACGQLALVLPGKDKDKAITGGDEGSGMGMGGGTKGASAVVSVVRDVEDVVSVPTSSSSFGERGGGGKMSKRPVAISTRSQGNKDNEHTITTTSTTTNSSSTSSSQENNNTKQEMCDETDQNDSNTASTSSSYHRKNQTDLGVGGGGVDGKWSFFAGGVLMVLGVTGLIGVVLLSRKSTLR